MRPWSEQEYQSAAAVITAAYRVHVDGLATMRVALVELSRATHVERTSHVYATAAIGGVPQGEFLNAAALVLHDGTPGRLLEVLLEIEQRLGRVRREKSGNPATLRPRS